MSKSGPRRRRERLPTSDTSVVETTVFRSGNSDAVRLPKRFGLLGKRVHVRRLDSGRLLIEAKRKRTWPAGFLETFGRVTEDFAAPARPAPDAADDAQVADLFRDERE
jgi:virulence-associated protein VagC